MDADVFIYDYLAAFLPQGLRCIVIRMIVGDCRSSLQSLPEKTVNCVVTSPPYFGLRDYGVARQIGLEQTPDEYVAALVDVFSEVRRVLRDDGTLWLNLGDSYYNYRPGKGQALIKQTVSNTKQDLPDVCARRGNKLDGLKEKDLIGIPWRVAFALQADGWYLRQDIIWHKPNPMPESVRDRCTKAHEYIFLLSKSERYFFDSDAMREPAKTGWNGSSFTDERDQKTKPNLGYKDRTESEFRNRRSVWSVATRPFKGAHFATYPTELIEPCILAGCPEGGTVLDPFFGAGTTGLVASRNGRNCIGLELNRVYADLAADRIRSDAGIFSDVCMEAML